MKYLLAHIVTGSCYEHSTCLINTYIYHLISPLVLPCLGFGKNRRDWMEDQKF